MSPLLIELLPLLNFMGFCLVVIGVILLIHPPPWLKRIRDRQRMRKDLRRRGYRIIRRNWFTRTFDPRQQRAILVGAIVGLPLGFLTGFFGC